MLSSPLKPEFEGPDCVFPEDWATGPCSGIVPVVGDELCQSKDPLDACPKALPEDENPVARPGLNAPDVEGDGIAGGGGNACILE